MSARRSDHPERERCGVGGTGCRLPPDVEPAPQSDSRALITWLERQPIAAWERGAAHKGIAIGAALAAFVVRFVRSHLGSPSLAAERPAAARASFPRLRRVPFYRRARALQFKRGYGRLGS